MMHEHTGTVSGEVEKKIKAWQFGRYTFDALIRGLPNIMPGFKAPEGDTDYDRWKKVLKMLHPDKLGDVSTEVKLLAEGVIEVLRQPYWKPEK